MIYEARSPRRKASTREPLYGANVQQQQEARSTNTLVVLLGVLLLLWLYHTHDMSRVCMIRITCETRRMHPIYMET